MAATESLRQIAAGTVPSAPITSPNTASNRTKRSRPPTVGPDHACSKATDVAKDALISRLVVGFATNDGAPVSWRHHGAGPPYKIMNMAAQSLPVALQRCVTSASRLPAWPAATEESRDSLGGVGRFPRIG